MNPRTRAPLSVVLVLAASTAAQTVAAQTAFEFPEFCTSEGGKANYSTARTAGEEYANLVLEMEGLEDGLSCKELADAVSVLQTAGGSPCERAGLQDGGLPILDVATCSDVEHPGGTFGINAPLEQLRGVTEITGSLTVRTLNLDHLSALRSLEAVRGNLRVIGGSALTSLAGLESLTSIGGSLTVNSEALTSLAGLEALTSVGGSLFVRDNDALNSLTGLENLESVEGRLFVLDNDALTSLTGLESLESVGGSLAVLDNGSLNSLTGLESLESVGGSLSVLDNSSPTSLTGLESLESVGGSLLVTHSTYTELAGLRKLESVGRNLTVTRGAARPSVAGLFQCTVASLTFVLGGFGSAERCEGPWVFEEELYSPLERHPQCGVERLPLRFPWPNDGCGFLATPVYRECVRRVFKPRVVSPPGLSMVKALEGGRSAGAAIVPVCSSAEDIPSDRVAAKLDRLLENIADEEVAPPGSRVQAILVRRAMRTYELLGVGNVERERELEARVQELYAEYPHLSSGC